MAELYRSIGFEVLLESLPAKEEIEAEGGCSDDGCTACFDVDPQRYRIIFTRSSGAVTE
jgi:hypothetical protein